jgi:hypothetical protein
MTFRIYPAVVASLPHVAHFTAERPVPMTRLRVDQRLALLHPADREQILRGEVLASWAPAGGLLRFHGDASGATEAERIAARGLAEAFAGGGRLHPGIRGYLELRRDQRLFLAALRHRRQGAGPEVLAGLDPGFAPESLRRHLRLHWQEPDLNLARRHPWLPEVRRFLEAGAALELRRALMQTAWDRLRRLRDADPLGVAAVAAFFFSWQITVAWAGHDPDAARERFRRLVHQALPASA